MKRAVSILSVDSLAGMAVGALTLALTPLLTGEYFAWPIGYVLWIGGANLLYGCYSGVLALRARRTGSIWQAGVILLIIANSVWAGQCFAQIWWLLKSGEPPLLMLLHMGLEGVFVAALSFVEAKLVLPVSFRD